MNHLANIDHKLRHLNTPKLSFYHMPDHQLRKEYLESNLYMLLEVLIRLEARKYLLHLGH